MSHIALKNTLSHRIRTFLHISHVPLAWIFLVAFTCAPCHAVSSAITIESWQLDAAASASFVDDPGGISTGDDMRTGSGITNTTASSTYTGSAGGSHVTGVVTTLANIWQGPGQPDPWQAPNPPLTWYDYGFDLKIKLGVGIFLGTASDYLTFKVDQPSGLWLTSSYTYGIGRFGGVYVTQLNSTHPLSVSFPTGPYYELSPGEYRFSLFDNKPNVGVYNTDTYEISGYLATLPEPNSLVLSAFTTLLPRRRR